MRMRHTAICPVCTGTSDHGLCLRCLRRLERCLRDIIIYLITLELLTEPRRSSIQTGTTSDPRRAPIDLRIAEATDKRSSQIAVTLTGWARIIVEQRTLSSTPSDLTAAAQLIHRQLNWLSTQDYIQEINEELHRTRKQLRKLTGDTPPAALGHCNNPSPHDPDTPCRGPMRYTPHNERVTCGKCGDTWNKDDLPHLLRVIQPRRLFPVPRAWITRTYGIPPGTLRAWINRGHVRTYSDEQVELFDVLQRIRPDGNRTHNGEETLSVTLGGDNSAARTTARDKARGGST